MTSSKTTISKYNTSFALAHCDRITYLEDFFQMKHFDNYKVGKFCGFSQKLRGLKTILQDNNVPFKI